MTRRLLVILMIVFSASAFVVADAAPAVAEMQLAQRSKKKPGFFQRLFGPREKATPPRESRPVTRRQNRREVRREPRRRVAASYYQTLCVRACDGYYFPISRNVPRSRLNVDDTVCKAMYGGAPAAVYYHASNSDIGRAVSLAGQRYAAHPNALRYRSTFDETCVGQLHKGLDNVAQVFMQRAGEAETENARAPALPGPRLRPSPTEDPATLANRVGTFRWPSREEGPGGHEVAFRRLGADYYYRPPLRIETIDREPWRPVDLSFAWNDASEASLE